jgi:hypothetical protein
MRTSAEINWCPLNGHGQGGRGVQRATKFVELNDVVEPVDFVAKSASLVYSIDAAIFLRLKELPKLRAASPPLGTMPPLKFF